MRLTLGREGMLSAGFTGCPATLSMCANSPWVLHGSWALPLVGREDNSLSAMESLCAELRALK